MEKTNATPDPTNIPASRSSGGGAPGSSKSHSRADEKLPANWELWAFITHCKKWQAVALSLGFEPPKCSHEVRGWPDEYERRLKITDKHFECNNLARSKADFESVDLPVFGAWAQSLAWSLPDRFPRTVQTNDAAQPIFDNTHPNYPSELDIALQAWRAVSTTADKGKPKARIKAWLDSNTKLSNEAKERIATVANWDKTGGATRAE